MHITDWRIPKRPVAAGVAANPHILYSYSGMYTCSMESSGILQLTTSPDKTSCLPLYVKAAS